MRSDSSYCNASCRAQYNKKKRDHEADMEVVKQEQDDLQTEYERQLKHKLQKLKDRLAKGQDANENIARGRSRTEQRLREAKGYQRQFQNLLQQQHKKLKDSNRMVAGYIVIKKELEAQEFDFQQFDAKRDRNEQVERITQLLQKQADNAKTIKDAIADAEQELVVEQNFEQEYLSRIEKFNRSIEKNDGIIKKIQLQIEELEKALLPPKPQHVYAELRPFSLKPKQVSRKPRKPTPQELTSGQLRNMRFNSFVLPGELGRFLGHLERNKLAFALTGDSGAGKSNFSYALVTLFSHVGLKTIYHSLEEGLNRLTQEKLVRFDTPDDVVFTEARKLSDIRKNANDFDVIVVDSFTQVEAKPEDFEALRQDFPQTIFIMIFQKTTKGTIRGGSSIKYNSSAAIDVVIRDGERVAIMEKSRYGTQGWEYSISHDSVIYSGLDDQQLYYPR